MTNFDALCKQLAAELIAANPTGVNPFEPPTKPGPCPDCGRVVKGASYLCPDCTRDLAQRRAAAPAA